MLERRIERVNLIQINLSYLTGLLVAGSLDKARKLGLSVEPLSRE